MTILVFLTPNAASYFRFTIRRIMMVADAVLRTVSGDRQEEEPAREQERVFADVTRKQFSLCPIFQTRKESLFMAGKRNDRKRFSRAFCLCHGVQNRLITGSRS